MTEEIKARAKILDKAIEAWAKATANAKILLEECNKINKDIKAIGFYESDDLRIHENMESYIWSLSETIKELESLAKIAAVNYGYEDDMRLKEETIKELKKK